MTPVRTRQAGLYTLSAALLVSAAALGQPLSDQPGPGQKTPPSAGPTKTVPSLPPAPNIFPFGLPVATLNDHLERIPKCYIIGGTRQVGPSRSEYIDTSGQVIRDLSVPSLPDAALVSVPHSVVKPSEEIAKSLDTRRPALP